MKQKVWIVGIAVAIMVMMAGGVVWAAEEGLKNTPADQAQIQRPRRVADYVLRGTVTQVEDEVVSLETAAGETARLLMGKETRLWVPGQPPTTTVELSAGDPVLAFGLPVGTEGEGRTLEARVVVVVEEEELPKIVIQGEILAITQQTIVVQTRRVERAITVLPRTRIWSRQGQLDSLRDVHPGDRIIALGQPTEMGQWIAGLVLAIGPEAPGRNGLRGQVTAVAAEAGTLAVETETREEITVITDEETAYRIPGAQDGGLANIQVGDRIVAMGRFEGEGSGTFLAWGIGVIVPPDGRQQPGPSDT